MFDFFSYLYQQNADFVNGAASFATLAACVFAVKKYLQSRQKKIFFQWVREFKVSSDVPSGYKVKVEYKDVVGSVLTTDIITISNRTDITLTDVDFVKPIRIPRIRKKEVFQCEVVPFSNGADANIDLSDEHLTLTKIEIPRDKTLTVFLAHENAFPKKMFSNTKALPELVERNFNKPNDTPSVYLFSIGLYLLLLVALPDIVDSIFNKMVPDDAHELVLFPFGLGAILFMLGAIFVLAFWIPQKLTRFVRPLLGISKEEALLSGDSVGNHVEKVLFSHKVVEEN